MIGAVEAADFGPEGGNLGYAHRKYGTVRGGPKRTFIQLFLLPDVFIFTPIFVPGRFFGTVLAGGFFASVFFVGAFVLSFLAGVFFIAAFFAGAFFAAVFLAAFFAAAFLAGALGRGEGPAAVISGAVRKSTAALVKFASSSIFDICEASSVTNLAPSMELATKAPIPGGVDRSCRPAMTRTLFLMLRMASR